MDILTLLKANIRYKKGSFLCVLILTFIISICVTSIISINYNIDRRADESMKLNKVGDLTAIIADVSCPDSMLNKVEAVKGIDHISVIETIAQETKVNNIKLNEPTFFREYDPVEQSYQIYNEDGLSFVKEPEELQLGEAYVPISFKRLYDCKAGDKLYITIGDKTKCLTIKAFFEEPFVGNEMIGIKLALMNKEDFESLYSQRILSEEEEKSNEKGIYGYYLINIYQDKNSNIAINDLKRSINDASGLVDYSVITINKDLCKSVTLMLTQIISGIMMVFLVLLFVVVLIVMGHSISTGIEMDYTNLGVLKAIGFPKGKLRIAFILEYILAELIGMTIGILGSIPSVYYLNAVFVSLTGLLSSVRPAFGICLAILAAVLLVSALFIFIKTRAIIKVSPICAISGGRSSIYFHSRLEIPVEGRTVFLRMAFRQLTSNMRQYISSTVIVAILVYFLITITILNTGMDEQTIENSFGVTYSDVGINYKPDDDMSDAEIKELQKQVEADISSVSSIVSSFKIGSSYFLLNGDEYHGSIYNDPTMLKSILKGRAPLYDNEIVITEIVAKELGVKIGDTVTVANDDIEEKYMISGYYQGISDLGRTFALSYEGAKKIMPDYQMDYIDYSLQDADKSAEVVKILEKKYGDSITADDFNAQYDFGDTIIGSMEILNVIIYYISILFSFVVILIVCGKIFLKEKTDYGIYKALGFTSFSLRLQFAIRFALVAFVGSLIGVVLNLCLNDKMMSLMLINIGITSFPFSYTLISIIAPIALLTTCFFVFAYFLSAKIKTVDTKTLINDN